MDNVSFHPEKPVKMVRIPGFGFKSLPKYNLLYDFTMSTFSERFVKIHNFWVIVPKRTNGQTV